MTRKFSTLDVRVVLDAFALGDSAETLEKRPQIGRLDDAVFPEVAHVQLHRDGALKIEELSLYFSFCVFPWNDDAFPVGVTAAE